MRIPGAIRIVFCALLSTGVTGAAYAQAPAAAPAGAEAKVDQLSWISGAWTGTLGERTIEQHWSAPLAGSIIAMYRSIQGGRPTLYELLAIEQDGPGVVLRIKHFAPGAGLASREAKDESIDHRLTSLGDRTAVFEGTGANTAKVTFKSPDPASLTIVVERQREGKTVATEFKYTRIAAKHN